MSENKTLTCSVTTFFSPSLFWIVYEDDIVKRHQYNERFNEPLVQFEIITNVSVNQKVLLQHRETWYRAEVTDIRQITFKDNMNQNKLEYICWLMDYGYFVIVHSVYKLQENELLIPPFARRTMLYGIRSTSLDYDFGISQMKEKIEDDWLPGIRRYAYDLLKAPHITCGFLKKFNFEDFLIGDLFIINEDNQENIKYKFIEKVLAKEDEVHFMSNLQMLTKFQIDMVKVYLETRFFIEDAKRLLNSPERSKGYSTFRAMQTYFVEQEKKKTDMSDDDDDDLVVDKLMSGRARKLLKMYENKQHKTEPIGRGHGNKKIYENIQQNCEPVGRGYSSQKSYANTVMKNFKMDSSHNQITRNSTVEDDCRNYEDVYNETELVKQSQNLNAFEKLDKISDSRPSSSQSEKLLNKQSSNTYTSRGTCYKGNTKDNAKRVDTNLEKCDMINNVHDDLIDSIRFGKLQKTDYESDSSITTEVSVKCVPYEFNTSEWNNNLNQVKFIGRNLLKLHKSFKSDSDPEIFNIKDQKVKEQNLNENKILDTPEKINQIQNLGAGNKQDICKNFKQPSKERVMYNKRDKFPVNDQIQRLDVGNKQDICENFEQPYKQRTYDESNFEIINNNTCYNTKDMFPINKNSSVNSQNIKEDYVSGRNVKPHKSSNIKKKAKIFGRDYGSKILSVLNDDEISYGCSGDKEIESNFKSKYDGRGCSHRSESSSSESNDKIPSAGRGYIANKFVSNTKTIRQDFDSSKSSGKCVSSASNKMKLKTDDVFKDVEEEINGTKNSSVFRKAEDFVENVQYYPAGLRITSIPSSVNQKTSKHDSNDCNQYKRNSTKNTCTRKTVKIAGFCDCKDCEKWRNNDNVFDPPSIVTPQPKEREIIKPPLLFKTNKVETTKFKIKTKRNFINDTEKLAAPRLLVHGSLLVDPTNDITHTPFNEEVQQGLRDSGYTNAYSIQSYAWPSILRGHNCIIVGSPGSGKTMSYVPPICQFVLNPNPYLPKERGPIAIILCPRVDIVEHVHRTFGTILRKNSSIYIITILQMFEQSFLLRMLKFCDVLITTPRLLIRMMKINSINLNRINYVVFDEAQDLFSLFSPEMDFILRKIQKLLENRTDGIPIQLIAFSQEWNRQIENLAKKFKIPPFICIGSHLEAALYGRADINLQIMNSQDKIVKLIDVIKNITNKCKILIICNDNDNTDELVRHFIARGIDHDLLLTESSIEEIMISKQRWSNVVTGHKFILVCSDNIFNTGLAISDADVMIQYSLPENWSQFIYRFSCFIDNYNSPLDLNKNIKHCQMHIFIDETNSLQFPKMLQFLNRMGSKLTDNFEKLYDRLVTNEEMKKLTYHIKLCDNLLRFGSCKQHLSCKFRHILCPEIDVSKTLPKLGLIKCKILNIISPVQYSVRLLEYTDGNGVQHKVKDYFSIIATQMLTLKEESIPMPITHLKVGRSCAVQESFGIYKDSFQRCVIIDIIRSSNDTKIKKVLVKFIDLGYVQCVNFTHIYFLPKYLKNYPPQSVPVYISNIGPVDKDSSWSSRCSTSFKSTFKHAGYGQANSYFTGRILLQLKDSLFVDDLKLLEVLDDDDDDDGTLIIQRLSVCNLLKKLQCVENRPEHLKNLYALCSKYKITLQDYNLPMMKKCIKEKPQVKPNWAHLENGEEFNNVYFCLAHDPHTFFIRLSKNIDRLEKLNKDIAQAINKPLYPKITSPKEGNCYLVKDVVDQTYSRVILREIKDNIGQCLFVDYGDTVEVPLQALRYLPDNLITQLPFQAIECKLYGVEPSGLDDTWASEATDILYNIAYEPNTDIWRTLHVKIMTYETPEYTGYKKYSVILVNTFNNKEIINNSMLDMGYAVLTAENFIEVDFNKITPITEDNKSETEEDELDDDENLKDKQKEKENEIYEYKELNFEDDDRWELQINNPDDFFPDFMKVSKEEQKSSKNAQKHISKIKEKTSNTNLKALPPPGHGCSTPNLIWQQTNTHVIIKIQIPSVDTYDVKIVRYRMLIFKGTYKETSYRLDLNLYAKVNSAFEHSNRGLYIYVKINKQESLEWPRLILSDKKQRNITYNVSVIPVDDEYDNDDDNPLSKKMIENSKKLGDDYNKDAEEGPYRFEIGSDIDWNESDVESEKDSDDY